MTKNRKSGYQSRSNEKHLGANAGSPNYNTGEVESAFKQALQEYLGVCPDTVIGDGKIRRFSSNGKKRDKTGWYRLYLDGIPAGSFGCFRRGLSEKWVYKKGDNKPLTPAERRQLAKQYEQIRSERRKARIKQKERTRLYALSLWRSSSAVSEHPYYQAKQIQPLKRVRLETKTGALLVPMYSIDKKMRSIQRIFPDGNKRYLKGTDKKGLFFVIGEKLITHKGIWVCEGLATGASLAEHLEYQQPVVVAFDSNNLLSVVRSIATKAPFLAISIMADDDRLTEKKTGVNTGLKGANSVKANYPHVEIHKPAFPEDAPIELSDFNDLVCWQRQQGAKP